MKFIFSLAFCAIIICLHYISSEIKVMGWVFDVVVKTQLSSEPLSDSPRERANDGYSTLAPDTGQTWVEFQPSQACRQWVSGCKCSLWLSLSNK